MILLDKSDAVQFFILCGLLLYLTCQISRS